MKMVLDNVKIYESELRPAVFSIERDRRRIIRHDE